MASFVSGGVPVQIEITPWSVSPGGSALVRATVPTPSTSARTLYLCYQTTGPAFTASNEVTVGAGASSASTTIDTSAGSKGVIIITANLEGATGSGILTVK